MDGIYRYKPSNPYQSQILTPFKKLHAGKGTVCKLSVFECSGLSHKARTFPNTIPPHLLLMEHFETVDELANADLNEPGQPL